MKDCWPGEVRRNPTGDPLLRLVAVILAQRDWAEVQVQAMQDAADLLQRLIACLRERFGDQWWEALGLPPDGAVE